MNIINQSSATLTKQELFKATLSPTIQKMSECEGEVVEVSAWVIYQDIDKKDSEKLNTILSIVAKDGTVRATNSYTFIEMFNNIVGIMGAEPFNLLITGGESKAGRHYITCDLVM